MLFDGDNVGQGDQTQIARSAGLRDLLANYKILTSYLNDYYYYYY